MGKEKILINSNSLLVSQSYDRGFNHFAKAHKIDILVSDYDSLQYAKIHYQAIKHDKYAYIIYLENDTHKSKFKEMITGENTKCIARLLIAEKLYRKRWILDTKTTSGVISKNTPLGELGQIPPLPQILK